MRNATLASVFTGLVLFIGFAPIQANTVYGTVNVTIGSPALLTTQYLLFEFVFGIGPSSGTSSTPASVTATTGPNVSWGSPSSTVPNTVNGFYSGNSTVAIGNYSQFVAKSASTLGADYNKVLFLNLVSPGAPAIVFTLADPPGPATLDAPLSIIIHGPNNGPDLFTGSFLFGKDGSFTPISLSSAQGVDVTSTLVPLPSAITLFMTAFGTFGLGAKARRARPS